MTTLLYSGNLGLGQDLKSILEAVARFNSDTKLHTLIVGSGKGLLPIKKHAADLQLKNIEFRKPVPLYQLNELLRTGDIHIICQKLGTEGLLVPSKIYGTLAVGRPSLFVGPTKCEVSRIISDSRSGYAIEPGDVQGVFNALNVLVQSKALRLEMGTNAREYYESYFGRKKSVTKIISIIENLALKNHPSQAKYTS